jgi:hypothetical protein
MAGRFLPFTRFLDTNGDGTGTNDAVGDYSEVAQEFYIECPADESFFIARMIVAVGDTTVMQAQEYGNLGSALGVGVAIDYRDDAGVVFQTLTNGFPIKTNAGWGQMCYDADVKAWGAGNELLLVRWTFERHGHGVDLDPGHKFVVTLNDDFEGLLSHTFAVEGTRRTRE